MRPNNNNHSSLNISNQDRTRTPKRNLFVTFWLWLCIIFNGIMISIDIHDGFYYFYESVSAVLTIVGYIMLLKWRKWGFYLVCLAWTLQYFFVRFHDYCMYYPDLTISDFFIRSICNGSVLGYIGFFLINFGILLGILQIKKNGVSCWSQLRW